MLEGERGKTEAFGKVKSPNSIRKYCVQRAVLIALGKSVDWFDGTKPWFTPTKTKRCIHAKKCFSGKAFQRKIEIGGNDAYCVVILGSDQIYAPRPISCERCWTD